MTIDKAIEILDNHQCDLPRNDVPDLIAAIKLGIEALNAWQKHRGTKYVAITWLLPGETQLPHKQ